MKRFLMILALASQLIGPADARVKNSQPRALADSARFLAPMLADPRAAVDEIVFAVRPSQDDGHWYENFGGTDANRVRWHDGARLCRLNLRTGKQTVLLEDLRGGIRDPQVHYDACKILFAYRKGGSDHYRLYEVNTDGSGLHALTEDGGTHDDIEPAYVPDGGIVFGSSRCIREVPCWSTEVAVLYRCDADGRNIRRISANVEHENSSCVLPDGRILYMRWEYVDRHVGRYHHLWTVNPDGTQVAPFYGNQFNGGVYLDAQPIPGTNQVLYIHSPGHGMAEHMGCLSIVSQVAGPDQRSASAQVGPGSGLWCRDPYPLSEGWFLVADDSGIYLADREGRTQLLYRVPAEQSLALQYGGKYKGQSRALAPHEPRPLRSRPREPVIPRHLDGTQSTGTLVLSDVRHGRRLGPAAGAEIRKILVLEVLPKPGPPDTSADTNLDYPDRTYRFLKRVVGEFPVEADGSACVEVPALRALQLVALDVQNRSVKHMLSFLSVMPGETIGCTGCHENRTQAPPPRDVLRALQRPPTRLGGVDGVPEIIDFPRDVQPILDRHCVGCHNADKLDGRVDLSADQGVWRSFGFVNLVRDGRVSLNWEASGNVAPRSLGSSASPIMANFQTSHKGVKLTAVEQRVVQIWIDGGVTYRGAYSAAPARIGIGKADQVFGSRCASCHPGRDARTFSLMRFADRRLGISPQSLLLNLSHPEKSLALRAPLDKAHGGLGWCHTMEHRPVFADRNDPDSRLLLEGLQQANEKLSRLNPKTTASEYVLRKMKFYGLLPPECDVRTSQVDDVFELDRRYFQATYAR